MWSPTGLIPWFSKTEGNTYATLLHHPLLFGEIQRSAQEVARRISGAVAGEAHASKSTIPSIHRNPYLSHYIICHLPLVFLSPTSPLPFYSPSLFSVCLFLPVSCLLVCWIACLSRWLKIILNCVTSPIPTITISLALRLLLLIMMSLVKSIPLC